MTEAEKERAAIVAWLREERGRQLTWRERIWLSWMALRHGSQVCFAARLAAANFIERGNHHA